jgi:hypothetical protein
MWSDALGRLKQLAEAEAESDADARAARRDAPPSRRSS